MFVLFLNGVCSCAHEPMTSLNDVIQPRFGVLKAFSGILVDCARAALKSQICSKITILSFVYLPDKSRRVLFHRYLSICWGCLGS